MSDHYRTSYPMDYRRRYRLVWNGIDCMDSHCSSAHPQGYAYSFPKRKRQNAALYLIVPLCYTRIGAVRHELHQDFFSMRKWSFPSIQNE